MTVSEWLREAKAALAVAGVDAPRTEAQLLAGHVLRVDRPWLLAHPDHEFNDLAGAQLLERRLSYEPLAYILGWREFYGREFGVDPSVLIPRHETETLVEAALALDPKNIKEVLDIGAGSGAIGLTLKLERPEWDVTGVDISPAALATASANARFLNAKVRLIHSDLFEALLGESFDLIVSNPPYVASNEPLPKEIDEHEPRHALYAGADGLVVYRRLAAEAPKHLADNGLLLVELGIGQREAVQTLFEVQGWTLAQIYKDLSAVERVLAFKYSYECSEREIIE